MLLCVAQAAVLYQGGGGKLPDMFAGLSVTGKTDLRSFHSHVVSARGKSHETGGGMAVRAFLLRKAVACEVWKFHPHPAAGLLLFDR